ncbi:MAG: hypothetical protein Q8O86_13595, partial [Dehalococcoidia bacterium]|nr:hypothetical protein [Dehalococcoidia bacterium]
MPKELRPIDISHTPELLHLVEELRKGDEPRVLRRGSEDLAILTPLKGLPRRRALRAKTKADYEAFLSSAGSWKDIVDTDKLVADIYESRRRSSRPPVD